MVEDNNIEDTDDYEKPEAVGLPPPPLPSKKNAVPSEVIKPAPYSVKKPSAATMSTGEAAAASSSYNASWRKWLLVGVILAVLIVLAVTLPIVLTRKEEPGTEPVAVDFTTGVSLLTYYGINATIRSRLATSVVTMEVANALDCSSIHAITLQLPLGARVVSLKTTSHQGDCETRGQVMSLEDARTTFVETASQGLPGAYVEERDSFTYSIQVSIPPLGMTQVELVLEELLQQRVGLVEFQLPLMPNEKVDQVVLDLTVLDVDDHHPTEFVFENQDLVENGIGYSCGTMPPEPSSEEPSPPVAVNTPSTLNTTNTTNATTTTAAVSNKNSTIASPFHLDVPDAREHSCLPKVLRGSFQPGLLPDHGILRVDEYKCFEHIFHPANLKPMSKNMFVLLDISESMGSYDKIGQAKRALEGLINSLSPDDQLTIQAFGRKGTEELWGSAYATEEEKEEAKAFVRKIRIHRRRSYGTNLHEAYLEGLLRAKRDADKAEDEGSAAVTILVMLSDGWASEGETDRAKIASDVYKLNQGGQVKIFALGLDNADIELLRAIAIMNGGVAAPVISSGSDVDLQSQMRNFFDSEFGGVLLSDVSVDFDVGEGGVYGETRRKFPVLADGTEIVVRGRLDQVSTATTLRALTTANTKDGATSWTAEAMQDPFVVATAPDSTASNATTTSRCFQSYAHARITQLLHWRDAAVLLGDDVLEPVVALAHPSFCKSSSLADCIEQEALALAIEANVVTRGLTGMVTVDEDECLSYEGETEICLDGTSENGDVWDDEYGPPQTASGYYDSSSHSFHINTSLRFLVLFSFLCFLLLL